MTAVEDVQVSQNGHAKQALPKPGLYVGQVMHGRLTPFEHRFIYRVFSVFLDIDDAAKTLAPHRFVSNNRWNLFSFFEKDHGLRDGSPLRDYCEALCAEAGLQEPKKIYLLCFPRILGYVFNPLSVYYCYDKENRLSTIIYEVRNTHGGLHPYVLKVDAKAPLDAEPDGKEQQGTRIRQIQGKDFYVSPFLDMDLTYNFRMLPPGKRLHIRIHETREDDVVLSAIQTGDWTPLSDRTLLRLFFTHPLMTLKVFGAIHLEAAKLFFKGAKYHPTRNKNVAGRISASSSAT